MNVPRDRKGEFKTSIIPRSKQYEEEVARDFSIMFLAGISTRTLSMLSERLIGRRVSAAVISSVSAELNAAVEAWRRRDLSGEGIKYLFVDGVHFHMRVGGSIEIVPVLVAIGVTEAGQKLVLSFQAGDKESATSWREFFKEEFPRAKVQRCQVHVARNVLAKVPQKFKQDVSNDLRSIFYAPSPEKAWESFAAFQQKWQKAIPSAVECLERSIEACLTFVQTPDNYITGIIRGL